VKRVGSEAISMLGLEGADEGGALGIYTKGPGSAELRYSLVVVFG
jgi:hypothetical protein